MIKRLRNIKAFKIKTKQEIEDEKKKKNKKQWTAFDLIPTATTDGEVVGLEYYYKTLCKIAANSDYELEKKLYEQYPLSAAWEQIALNTAIQKSMELMR